jgi:hypothetical protein
LESDQRSERASHHNSKQTEPMTVHRGSVHLGGF